MGLFDFFKPKPLKGNDSIISLSSFRAYYLYGFTQQPNQVASDKQLFGELYRLVIGDSGGIAISNSFHPYFIVIPKGTTVWNAAYVMVYTNDNKAEVFDSIRTQKAICTLDLSPSSTKSTFGQILA